MIKEIHYFSAFVILWSSVLLIVNFTVDPLQYYRMAESPQFIKNQRYQIPGLVRNYKFNTIMVGTSHSENFLSSELDRLMTTKSLNLAISGSSALEQVQVIELAAAQNTLKNVIWEMNYKSFAGSNPNLLRGGLFPYYLYKPNSTTLFYYLYSLDTLILSAKKLLGRGESKLEGLNSWADKTRDKFDGIHIIKHFCQRQIHNKEKFPVANYKQNLSEQLTPVLHTNKTTMFYLFIPPLSIANYALNNQIYKFIAFRKSLYEISSKFKNVIVIDFMTDIPKISNLNNYKDVEHYSSSISSEIIEKIVSTNHNKKENVSVNELNENLLDSVVMWKSKNSLCTTN